MHDIDYINKHGFDIPEDQQRLIDAVKNNKIEVVKKLIKKGMNSSPICGFNYKGQPLVYAVQAQNIEMIKLLISKGADVNGRNAYYDTPLIYALEIFKNIDFEIFEILLDADADVNQPNAFGYSPFIGACACGNLDLVKLMYKHGGDVKKNYVSLTSQNTFQETFTPLQAAESGKHKHVVKFLKEQGAN